MEVGADNSRDPSIISETTVWRARGIRWPEDHLGRCRRVVHGSASPATLRAHRPFAGQPSGRKSSTPKGVQFPWKISERTISRAPPGATLRHGARFALNRYK